MTTLSKFMATTAICTFIAGTAAAQGLGAEVGADVGVSADTSTSAAPEASTGLDIESSTSADVGAEADVETPDTSTMTATVDSGTAAAINAVTEAMASGQAAAVLSADGQILGQAETASQDARGAAELSINLDPALDTTADRVTYSGTADVDAEGRVILPLAQADFISRIMAQTDGSSG